MKNFIVTLMLFLTLTTGLFATPLSENVDNSDDRLNLQPQIENVYVNMPSEIYFIDSDTFDIKIRTKSEFLYRNIDYSIENGTVNIRIAPRFLSESFNLLPEEIKIYIASPNNKIKISTPRSLLVSDNRNISKSTNYENN